VSQQNKITYDQAKDLLMPFGKFKGESLGDLVATNKQYLEWALDELTLPAWLEEAIIMMLTDGRVRSIR